MGVFLYQGDWQELQNQSLSKPQITCFTPIFGETNMFVALCDFLGAFKCRTQKIRFIWVISKNLVINVTLQKIEKWIIYPLSFFYFVGISLK